MQLSSVLQPERAPAFPVRVRQSALLCLLLFLLSHTPSPAAEPNDNARETEPDAAALAHAVDPSAWKLSPEGEHLYYYLLLSRGLVDGTQELINLAVKELLRLDPSLPVYQDSVTILLAGGEYQAAENTAIDGLRHFPKDATLTVLLAEVYSESDRMPQAVSLLEEYLKIKPDEPEAMEELVRLYLKAGEEKKAADLLTRLPMPDDSPESELFRAGVLANVGRTAEAKEILRNLLKKQPTFYSAWLELAYIAEREKKTAEAIRAYEKAAKLMPDGTEPWFRIAVLHLAEKKPAEAMRAIEQAPPSPPLFIQAALRFAEAKYFREAERLLKTAVENGAAEDEAALLLSLIRQESSNDPKAGLKPLEKVAPGSPLYSSALEQRTRILLQAEDYEAARASAHQGRVMFPERKEFWGLEAFALLKLEKTAEAEKLLTDALTHAPDDENLLFSLGGVQDEIGKKDEAMRTMERLLALNPRNYQALNYVGYTLADKNIELHRALALIKAALEERPDADYIVDSLAWAQYRLGFLDEAWTSIKHCLELGGDDATIWEHYGDIAAALGKRKEAIKGYTESIRRKPDNIDDVRRKLTDVKNAP